MAKNIFTVELFENETKTLTVLALYKDDNPQPTVPQVEEHPDWKKWKNREHAQPVTHEVVNEQWELHHLPVWSLVDGDGTVKMVVADDHMSVKFTPLKVTAPKPRVPAMGKVVVGDVDAEFMVLVKAVPDPLLAHNIAKQHAKPAVSPTELILSLGVGVTK